ncbi:ankyrin repeat domain-containing protein [Rickettsiella endosymbiont of Dermanyssus gallinae]|uniref:ankyrin repeat domain-containing protein n=1 Tax=Rickettsiella endosymbiont of Dermanyssus gallinae TaxID=2856608 RepID=UPI001C533F6A|nr:ankyrin repeat domain-containing protein [Rickettsiella endosymbiont of Dermanyssus gallinae]
MVDLMNFLKLSYNEYGIAYSLAKRALEAFLLDSEASFLRHQERIRVVSNKAFLVQFQTLFRELNGCTDLSSEIERMENEGSQHRFNLLYDYAVIFLGIPLTEITLDKVYLKACQDIYSFLASVAAESKEIQQPCYLPYGDAVNVSENASTEMSTQDQSVETEDAIKKIDSSIDLYDDNALEAYLKKLQNCSERDRLAIHLTAHENTSAYALILIYNAGQACWFIENCGDYTLSESFSKDKFADMTQKIKQDLGLHSSDAFLLLETDVYHRYDQASAVKLSASIPFFITEMGYRESVEALLKEALVEVNAQTADGLTMLHLAVKNGDLDMVQLLLAKGADPNIKTKNGETAFTLAVSISLSAQNKIDYEDIIKVLIDGGVDFSRKKNTLASGDFSDREALSSKVQQLVTEIEKYSQCLNKKWIRRNLAKEKSIALMKIVRACKDNGSAFSEAQYEHIRNTIQQEEAVLLQHRHWPRGILYFFKQPTLRNRVSSYQKVMCLDHAIKDLLAT